MYVHIAVENNGEGLNIISVHSSPETAQRAADERKAQDTALYGELALTEYTYLSYPVNP